MMMRVRRPAGHCQSALRPCRAVLWRDLPGLPRQLAEKSFMMGDGVKDLCKSWGRKRLCERSKKLKLVTGRNCCSTTVKEGTCQK